MINFNRIYVSYIMNMVKARFIIYETYIMNLALTILHSK